MKQSIVNHRLPGETFADYKARRAAGNAAIKAARRGTGGYAVCEILTLPPAGVDGNADRLVRNDEVRDVTVLRDGTRRCSTVGVPYQKTA